MTAFVLPWQPKKGTAYAQWLCHPAVQEIKTVNRRHITFEHPQHWGTGQKQQGAAKWDIKFLVVANEAGLKEYVSNTTLETGFADAAQSREDKINKIKPLRLRHQKLARNKTSSSKDYTHLGSSTERPPATQGCASTMQTSRYRLRTCTNLSSCNMWQRT